MSTINVQPSKNAPDSVYYVLYGHSGERRQQLIDSDQTRAAAFAISMANGGTTPTEFIARSVGLTRSHGRKVQLQSYVLSFHPDEFDVTNPEDMERIRDVAVKLAERMHSADYLIVVHADSAGGHGHAHILTINHDNLTGTSLQRYTSWKNGLRQLNDDLMREEGLRVLPDPEKPKPDWEFRRESFAPDGFEQTLGDKVNAALQDPRSIDQTSFVGVLKEHGVTLAVTNRDGWSYKMRRADNGKLGRKKASLLTPEFTADRAKSMFESRLQPATPSEPSAVIKLPNSGDNTAEVLSMPGPPAPSRAPVDTAPFSMLVAQRAHGHADLRTRLQSKIQDVKNQGLFVSIRGYVRECAKAGIRALKHRKDLAYQLEGDAQIWPAAELGEQFTEPAITQLAEKIQKLRDTAPAEAKHLPLPQLALFFDENLEPGNLTQRRRKTRKKDLPTLTPARERHIARQRGQRTYCS